mgnify:CR=1 FL=1
MANSIGWKPGMDLSKSKVWKKENIASILVPFPDETGSWFLIPKFKPGDLVAATECFSPDIPIKGNVLYRAGSNLDLNDLVKWRPPMFMKTEWSRITLQIESVKAERIQDISEEDAIAEGVGAGFQCNSGWPDYQHIENKIFTVTHDTASMSFARLWDSIRTKPGQRWESNPICWAIKFERVKL